MPRTERNGKTVLLLRTEQNGTERNKNGTIKKEEQEPNDLAEGPRSRTEQNDFKKVGMCPALDKAQSVFSGICLTRYNSIRNSRFTQYHSQYQSGYGSVCILRYLSYKIQLNQELKVHTNTIANINQDMAQSVFSGICLTRCNSIRNSRFTQIT